MSVIILQPTQTLTEVLLSTKNGDTLVLADKTYREKVEIKTDNLTIIGNENGNSKIVFGDYAKKIHADGLEFNTFRTYTVNVLANGVRFENFTIENDAKEPSVKGQEVALSVYGDNFYAKNMTLRSTQDTLFLGPLPDDLITRYIDFLPYSHRYFEGEAYSLFDNCKIYGSVDYIFGCGCAFFFDCDCISVDDGRKTHYVVAPAHSLKQTFGFTFVNCRFKKENSFDCELYLARPWRDYGKATFISCSLTDDFNEQIFDKWNATERNRTARFELYNTINTENAVSWATRLTKEKVGLYINKLNFLNEKLS